MNKFKQETLYSCGAAALRNCFKEFDIIVSESKLRTICNSDRQKGTSYKGIIKGILHYGFDYIEYDTKSINVFKTEITKHLRAGNKIIALCEATEHWIALTNYYKKIVTLIDSGITTGGIKHYTLKELSEYCLNFDKSEKRSYYYFIIIKHKQNV